MKIILSKDIPNLGEEGDIKIVADGYARNYLLPNKLVMPYTSRNVKALEQNRASIEKRKEEKRKNALGLKERLESEVLTVAMPAGDTGKLFGSVNNAVIADVLEKQGLQIERKRIDVPEHNIKMLGEYTIKIKLYESQVANLKVNIVNADHKAAPAPEVEPASAAAPEAPAATEAPAGEEATPEAPVDTPEESASEA